MANENKSNGKNKPKQKTARQNTADTRSKTQDISREQRKANRIANAKEFAKDITYRGAKAGFDVVKQLAKGNIIGAAKTGLKQAASTAKHAVRAITGTNDTGWYVKYYDITPAANTARPMAPRFNEDITLEALNGGTCRMMEVHLEWTGFQDSFMWKQTVNNSYQLLRLKLKSNLPYSVRKLEAYLFDALTLFIVVKQLERDVHWYNFSDADITNFQELFIRRAVSFGTYGITELTPDSILADGSWADTVSGYERLEKAVATNIRVAPSLSLFVSHYFGTMFTDQGDGYNDQYTYLRMIKMQWATYDAATDTVKYEDIDFSTKSIDQITAMTVDLGTTFGIVIADLVNSGQYVAAYLDPLGEYSYDLVYDRSLMQALQNAYTDRSCVTNDGYVRLDLFPGVDDPYTQYLFMGGVQEQSEHNVGLTNFPAIKVLSVCLKYDSDEHLKWPAGLTQRVIDLAEGSKQEDFVTMDGYFGINVVTSIEDDTYINTISAGAGATTTISPGQFENLTDESPAASGTLTFNIVSSSAQIDTGNTENIFPQIICTPVLLWDVRGKYMGQPMFTRVIDSSLVLYQWDLLQSNSRRTGFKLCTFDSFTAMVSTAAARGYHFTSRDSNCSPTIAYDAAGRWITDPSALPDLNLNGGAPINIEFTATAGRDYLFEVSVSGSANTATIVSMMSNAKFIIRMDGNDFYPRPSEISTSWSNLQWSWKLADAVVSAVSIKSAFNVGTSGTSESTVQIVRGYESLAETAAKESHMMIPIKPVHRVTAVTINADSSFEERTTYETTSGLIKHEHAPYYYNIKDLSPVLYNMMLSLFTPVDDIYRLLTLRKGLDPRNWDNTDKHSK